MAFEVFRIAGAWNPKQSVYHSEKNTLGPAKHEKVAIYVVNKRISNVCRIAGHKMRSNPCIIVGKISL